MGYGTMRPQTNVDLSYYMVLTTHTSVKKIYLAPPILFEFFKNPIHFLWKTAFCSIASELWDPEAPDQCGPVLQYGNNNTHLLKN